MSAESGKAQPVAYIRYRSDGGVDGPILAGHACDIRKREWTPLYPHPAPVRDALVEALTRLRGEWQYQCEIGNVPDGRIEIDRVDAALRAAGVEL